MSSAATTAVSLTGFPSDASSYLRGAAVELNSSRDLNGVTATVAAKLARELLGLMASC